MNVVIFFIVAVVLLIAVLAMLLPALLGRRIRETTDRSAQNLAIARDRLAELKTALQNGEITKPEYDQGREDIERGLADDLAVEQAGEAQQLTGKGPWAAVAVSVGVPVLAGSLYLGLGNPSTIEDKSASEAARPAADSQHPASMEKMIEQLAARLEANPDDPEGWSMLANTYMVTKRYADAASALERLRQLVGDNPQVVVRHADALAMLQGGRLSGQPLQLVKRALEMNPTLPQGLWMAGMAARQEGDFSTALRYWRTLEPLLANNPNSLAELRQLIDDVVERSEGDLVAENTQPAPADSQVDTTQGTADAGAAPSITVQVALNESLKQQVAPTDTLFVFARALQGPPMPLAVVRRQVADLPVTVTLDDNSAVVPTMKLSNYESVLVGARISKAGTASPESGDLQGEVSPVSTANGSPVNVLISQIVP